MHRWKYIGFLLGCVSLLLVGCGAAQEEAWPQLAKQVWEETEQEENTEKKVWTLNSPYAQAYYDFLEEFISGKTAAELEETGFYLALIDDDRIPELLLFHGDHKLSQVAVYTYYDEQVKELGEFGSYGEMMYYERSGIVIDHFLGSNGTHSHFCQIENGECREIAYLHFGGDYSDGDDGEEYTPLYEVDGVQVQREAFYVKWNELSNHQENIWIRFEDRHPLGKEELLSTLSQVLEKVLQPLFIEDMLWKRDSVPVLEQLAQTGTFGSFGSMQYVEQKGMIFSHFMGQGEATSGFYQMEDGVARLINCLRSWPDYSQEEYAELYEIDGFSVSEEEFSAKWEELYGSWEYVLIGYEDGIPLEGETLLTALEQAIEKLSLEDSSE